MTFKAATQRGLQGGLQLFTQASRLLGIVETKYPGATRAFEMSVLMLGWMILVARSFTASAITKHPVIARNFMCQSGIGQAIQCAVQGDPIHFGQGVLHFQMRQCALTGQEFRQDIQARISHAHASSRQQD